MSHSGLFRQLTQAAIERYPNEAAMQLEALPPRDTARLLEQQRPALAAGMLGGLRADYSTDVIEALSPASASQVLEKLEEEMHELAEARQTASQEHIEGEIGDILFVLVNLARFVSVDPEQALRKSNTKFRRRFAHVEQSLRERGKAFSDSSLGEMEQLWQQAKEGEPR